MISWLAPLRHNRPLAIVFWLAAAVLVALIAVAVTIHLLPQRSAWQFEIAYDRDVIVDLRFSPDGGKLAAVSADEHSREYRHQSVEIVKIPSGEVIHEIKDGAWQCAWNHDGTTVAVASWPGFDFRIWETNTWSPKQRLIVQLSASDKRVVNFVVPAGLCFDREGNLFVAEPYNSWDGVVPALPGAKAWWTGTTAAESIPTCSNDTSDVSVATVGDATRVAIASHVEDACTIEVLTCQTRGGRRTVSPRYKLDAAKARGLKSPWIRLTSNGRYLAARDSFQFCLFEVFEDHATLVHLQEETIGTSVAIAGKKLLDVSLDGRFAAYGGERRIRVVGIPSGASVLEVIQEPDSLAVSPDGRLLTVANRQRKTILFYTIPQTQLP
jgi:WD40 repeat protein